MVGSCGVEMCMGVEDVFFGALDLVDGVHCDGKEKASEGWRCSNG